MLKKSAPTKVVQPLNEGCTIREVRVINSKTNKIASSSFALYKGKNIVKGGFRTQPEVVKYFNEEVAKR